MSKGDNRCPEACRIKETLRHGAIHTDGVTVHKRKIGFVIHEALLKAFKGKEILKFNIAPRIPGRQAPFSNSEKIESGIV